MTGVVGNEDGAHKITADLHQALNDIGFTVPAQGGTYWNGRRWKPSTTKTCWRCRTRACRQLDARAERFPSGPSPALAPLSARIVTARVHTMGQLVYAASTPFDFDDRVLSHVKIAVEPSCGARSLPCPRMDDPE